MPAKLLLGFFFVFLFVYFDVTAQNQKIADSLVQVLSLNERSDVQNMELLTQIAQNQNDPKLKLRYAEQLMDKARDADEIKFLHHAYLQQGQAYRLMGDFEIAIYALFKALDYAEKCNFQNGIAGTNTALADVYSLIGDNSNAVSYYERSIDYLRISDSSLLANTLLNLGDEYYMSKIYDKALECFEESRIIYEHLNYDKVGLAYNMGNIGLVYAELDQLDKAESNVRTSIETLRELGDHYGRSIFLSYLAEIYQRKGRLSQARSLADSSMSIARRYSLKSEIRDNSLRLADIYAMSADFETAYRFHRQYVALKDSIANDNIYSRIENLKSAFDLAKKQSEVDLLKADKRNQQIVITGAILITAILMVLAIVSFGYYRSKSQVNLILEDQKATLESLNNTKDKYFSIISHDLRGSVSSFFGISRLIKQLVASKDMNQLLEVADDVDQSVERLSNLLDNLLNWAMQQQGQIPIVFERHNLLKMVLEIADTLSYLAKAKEIKVETVIAKDMSILVDRNTFVTVIRNLVSNALKFTHEKGKIIIKAEWEDHKTIISIIDNGIGIDEHKLSLLFDSAESTYGTSGEKGLGLGLQLVNEFVGLNNGSIRVNSNLGMGAAFVIELPDRMENS